MQHQSWRSPQLGKRTLETQPGDSAKEERERAAAIAGANAAKQRRKEEQEAELREAAARAAEAAAADEPGAGAPSSPSLAPLFAAKMKFTCGVKVRPLRVKTLVCASVMAGGGVVSKGFRRAARELRWSRNVSHPALWGDARSGSRWIRSG